MGSSITFSIITPVYNREDCIENCISTVLNQSFTDFELIIVNDGSNDKTLEKIQLMCPLDKKIRLITYDENKGANFARNRAIEQAKGDYIIFLDSDDGFSSDQSLREINQKIQSNPGFEHYLFLVSDRLNDKGLPDYVSEFKYKDWLSGKVSGDFAHVVKTRILKKFLFIETFRIYESLSWLRLLKNIDSQLFIPTMVVKRDRERSDSVSNEYRLISRKARINEYKYFQMYIDMYWKDYEYYGITNMLMPQVYKTVLIGISLREFDNNRKLIALRDSRKMNLLKAFNNQLFSFVISSSISLKSIINRFL
ncbi:glycosyltransferase family 2 protein [Siphonobacter curvatus]|uniref:Glycosyltransferase 2-like domain-containing protein n=1 Tax=Siphonobacter curvatus TaxID=2094562 RepID=A0A2S7IEG4_9BACT|nr:glycosyltransferase family 2 protein [Siphonobacter curvatus]PQA52733.1 hypothetical protein C5O19_25705 [Siphonobacter curvatus]